MRHSVTLQRAKGDMTMAIADPPRQRLSPGEGKSQATAPFRIYSADQQPIRLLAEIQGVSPAELVHLALTAYVRAEQESLAVVAQTAQEAFESGDYNLLRHALAASAAMRRRRRQNRLDTLSRPSRDG